jgi:hypothetical protein
MVNRHCSACSEPMVKMADGWPAAVEGSIEAAAVEACCSKGFLHLSRLFVLEHIRTLCFSDDPIASLVLEHFALSHQHFALLGLCGDTLLIH